MAVRYHTAEGAIQAAGAAFACPDDDLSTPRKQRRSRIASRLWTVASSVVLLLLV
jgi:hypothetical protein